MTTWGAPDAPVVVLVHGLGLSAQSWGRVPELLAPAHRVVAYDLRGHARSGDAASGDYRLEAHAEDLRAVLDDSVRDDRRAVVVGSSFGGAVILACVRRSGGKGIGGVVFAGSGGSGITFPGFPARGLPAWAETLLRRGWLSVLRGAASLGRRVRPIESVSNLLIRHFAFTPDAPPEVVARVRDDFLGTRPVALARTTLASVSRDGTRLAPALEVPTLVLHGDRDPEVPPEQIERLLRALPDAELVTFDGAAHMLALTHAEEVAAHIARWIRRVGAPPARS